MILLIIGLYRNHSDNHVEYNPFDDIREIDLMYDSFSLDEFPDKVKDEHYNFVEEFRDLLGSEYDIECVLNKGIAITVVAEVKAKDGGTWCKCKAGYYTNKKYMEFVKFI